MRKSLTAAASLSAYTRSHLTRKPVLGSDSFVAPSAVVMGSVSLGENVSVWYNAVLRADINEIVVGEGSNVQDGVVVHVTRTLPTRLGRNVSVGHNATLHGCTVEDNVLVGMASCLLDGCHIGSESVVAAGALVTPGKRFPPRSLIVGSPAKVARPLSDDEVEQLVVDNARRYRQYAEDHKTVLAAAEGKDRE